MIALLLFAMTDAARAGGDIVFATDSLVIEADGARHTFQVEMALTPAQRSRGLMFRKELAPDRGMLFVYPRDKIIRMWMKNTLISLDMLFLDATGRVVAVHEGATPMSLENISSGRSARGVLEVAAGTVARLGLKTGHVVRHPAFSAP